jgi:hypothetical protein
MFPFGCELLAAKIRFEPFQGTANSRINRLFFTLLDCRCKWR